MGDEDLPLLGPGASEHVGLDLTVVVIDFSEDARKSHLEEAPHSTRLGLGVADHEHEAPVLLQRHHVGSHSSVDHHYKIAGPRCSDCFARMDRRAAHSPVRSNLLVDHSLGDLD